MKTYWIPLVFLLFLLLTGYIVISAYPAYVAMQLMKEPRYEVGEHSGPESCAPCHQVIYNQWRNHSRHAVSTTAASFHEFKDKFESKRMLDLIMGVKLCYACHGSREADGGVDCETCHGLVLQGASIEETHERKFAPGRERLQSPEFCAACHQIGGEEPSEELIMSVFAEWQKSNAASQGITCQGCHMPPGEDGLPYHGFDTAVFNPRIYEGDLRIRDIEFDFPHLSLAVENLVTAHAVPVGGPTRVLALEISFLNAVGEETHKTVETFGKKCDLMSNLMPYKLVENTQIQSGEIRPLNFDLPASLEGQFDRIQVLLRFYEVSDEHNGDIEKAHWSSEPILVEEIGF